MKRLAIYELPALLACCLVPTVAKADVEFRLLLDAPPRVAAEPGHPVRIEVVALLQTRGLEPDVLAAQGWSIGIVAEGWRVFEATTAGTAGALAGSGSPGLRQRDGFEHTAIVDGPDGDPGVVSAVLLSTASSVSLNPRNSPHPILRITLEANAPARAGECLRTRVAFVDGLRGSGQPVPNKVTFDGRPVLPSRSEALIEVCAQPGFDLSWRGPSKVSGRPSSTVEAEFRSTLETRHLLPGDPGAQGWSIGVAGSGLRITDATTRGTAGADRLSDPFGLRSGGFEKTELTMGPGNEGAVSAVVLSFEQPITLSPSGSPHAILRVAIEGETPGELAECNYGTLAYRDGLVGSGRPVLNAVTYDGRPVPPLLKDTVVSFCAEPNFALDFNAPARIFARPGTAAGAAVVCELATSGVDPGEIGAQGWSIGVSADGLRIVGATTDATAGADAASDASGRRRGGFEKTELASAGGGSGAISAVILSFEEPVWLPPEESPHAILRLAVEADAPDDADACSSGRLFYADGLRGSGQPVENKVTYFGRPVRPALGDALIEFCAREDCCTAPLNLVFQTRNVGETGALFAGDVRAECDDATADGNTLRVPTPLGRQGTTSVFAGIVSQLEGLGEGGVQGWSISIAVRGDLEIAGLTTDGTATEDLFSGGFQKTEVVDPEKIHPVTGQPQGPGAVSAIVLSFIEQIALEESGTASVLRLDLRASRPQAEDDIVGEVAKFDRLRGSGEPVNSVASVNGITRLYCENRAATVRFHLDAEPTFSRCDANDDGRHDIADPIWVVNELFRGGPQNPCQKANDCNDDGQVDLSDATYSISYEFIGGPAPTAPFPACGVDPSEDLLPCGSNATRCE
jgi:hypothetical protein